MTFKRAFIHKLVFTRLKTFILSHPRIVFYRLTIALFIYNNDRSPSDDVTGSRAESAALAREAGARSHRGLADVDTNDVEDVNDDADKKEAIRNAAADKTSPKPEPGR